MKQQDINLILGGCAIDERGLLKFVNDFNFSDVKRFYQVENHSKNFIRAWHGHLKEGKYVYVVRGAILLGVVPMPQSDSCAGQGEPKRFILSSEKPSILYIPPNHANGFMTLTDDAIVQFFSTSSLSESSSDDIRFDYDKWNIWHIKYR